MIRINDRTFSLHKLRISSQGYEYGKFGKYYGTGLSVYHFEDYETGEISGEFRATCRQDAIAILERKINARY